MAVLGGGLMSAAVALGCSSSPDTSAWEEREQEAERIAPRAAEMSEWRQRWLPKLLAQFESNEPRDWHGARRELLQNEHTPARRMTSDGEVVDTHIRALLQQDDWDSPTNRAWLAQEGQIYEQLARFSSTERQEWRAARKTLVEMGEEGAERAALELVLRLGWTPDEESGHRSDDDMALWAIEELAAIGDQAVPVLIHGTYMRSMIEGMERNRYWENLYFALAEIGAASIEPLALDLRNARQARDDDTRFQRIRRQLRTLESIFENLRNPRHGAHVTDLSELERERQIAIENIGETLRKYQPSNDLRLYQIRLYAIRALEKIGSDAACEPLLWLWQQAAQEDDGEIVSRCREALTAVTGRTIDSFEDWQNFIATLD